jgi:hypothetical protein
VTAVQAEKAAHERVNQQLLEEREAHARTDVGELRERLQILDERVKHEAARADDAQRKCESALEERDVLQQETFKLECVPELQ